MRRSQQDSQERLQKRARTEKEEAEIPGKQEGAFYQIIYASGMRIRENKPDHLVVAPALFRRNVLQQLETHPSYPKVVADFLAQFETHIEDSVGFRMSMLPAEVSSQVLSSSTHQSAIRLLLGIDLLQEKLAEIILYKLPILANDGSSLDSNLGENSPRLILNQFRWLEHVVNPKALVSLLIEVLEATSEPLLKKEVISAIPEIVSDSEHKPIVDYLQERMATDSEVIVPTIDCLSNLSLKPNHLDEVRRTVLDRLKLADSEVLPVIVQFLLQTTTPETVTDVVTELRKNITFQSLGAHHKRSQASSSKGGGGSSSKSAERESEALLLETLKAGIHFQKFVTDEWLLQISSLAEKTAPVALDLLVLIIMFSIPSLKKRVIQTFKKKIEDGFFTLNFLEVVITKHSESLRNYFAALLSLAESLLVLPSPLCREYAGRLYELLFRSFEDYHRQEVVGGLVAHIGSGIASEVDAGLKCLRNLAENDPNSLVNFSILIKGVMDYLDDFSLEQVRLLFSLFNTLAYCAKDTESFLDDVNLVIRKQLSSPEVKYKRIGIVGGVAILQCPAQSSAGGDPHVSEIFLKQAKELLSMMLINCKKNQGCISLMYDELAVLIESGNVEKSLEAHIKETYCGMFIDYFLDGVDNFGSALKPNPPAQLILGLDDEASEVYVTIYLLMSHPNQQEVERLQYFCSMFKLYYISEKSANNGSLENSNALLSCAICSFKPFTDAKAFEALPQKTQSLLCATLFVVIDWLRELLNAFVGQPEEDSQLAVLTRLNHLLALEHLLQEFLSTVPKFTVPGVHIPDSVFVGARKGAGKAKPKAKKAKRGREIDGDGEAAPDDESVADSEESKTESFSVPMLRPFMREIEVNVFSMLGYPQVVKQLDDTGYEEEKKNPSTLKLSGLRYLLEDLDRKTTFKFVPQVVLPFQKAAPKTVDGDRNPFGSLARKSVKEMCKKFDLLIPILCQHLEAINSQLQNLAQSQSSVADFLTVTEKDLSECLSLLFAIIEKYFRWPELPAEHLKKSLIAVASRISKGNFATLEDAAFGAFAYFQKFQKDLPSVNCALSLFRVLEALACNVGGPNPSLAAKLSVFASELLRRTWPTPLKADAIGTLLEADLFHSDEIFVKTEVAVSELHEFMLSEKPSEEYPLLKKDNFAIHYRVVFDGLVRAVLTMFDPRRPVPKGSTQATQSASRQAKQPRAPDVEINLQRVETCATLFETLTVNLNEQPSVVLAAALKYGRAFVQAFQKICLPFFEDIFRFEVDKVMAIIKSFQKGTRSLQTICRTMIKDPKIGRLVPQSRKTLETVIFRVKAMLEANNLLSFFSVGNLKNRDMQGNEVSTQHDPDDEERTSKKASKKSTAKRDSKKGSKRKGKGKASEGEADGDDADAQGEDMEEDMEEDEEEEGDEEQALKRSKGRMNTARKSGKTLSAEREEEEEEELARKQKAQKKQKGKRSEPEAGSEMEGSGAENADGNLSEVDSNEDPEKEEEEEEEGGEEESDGDEIDQRDTLIEIPIEEQGDEEQNEESEDMPAQRHRTPRKSRTVTDSDVD